MKWCLYCGELIPEDKLKKHKAQKFCKREHRDAWRKENGFYSQFSAFGLNAQRKIKDETGHAPGAEKRATVLDKVRWRGGRPRQKRQI